MSRATSFRERLAWSSLGAHIVTFGGYFWLQAEKAGEPINTSATLLVLLALLVLALGFNFASRLEAPRGEKRPDEREHLIDLKAARVAGVITALGAGGVVVALVYGQEAVVAANLMLGVLVLAQIGGAITRIAHFKAGV